jgi:hypothetical protein
VASPAFDDLVATLRGVQRVGNPTVAEMREGWEKFAAQFPTAKDLCFESVDADGVPAE